MNRYAAKVALLGAFMMRPGVWDAEAAAWARLLPHDSPADYADKFAAMINAGGAFQLDIVDDEKFRVAIVVYSVDEQFEQPEFVIHAAYSKAGALDITAEFLPQLEKAAKSVGCISLRFTTVRPALIAKAIAHNYTVSEVFMRKDLRHG